MSTESDEPASDLAEALSAVSFVVMGALTKLAADRDLSLTQLRMIGILHDRTLTISELAGRLGLDRSSVSGLVDRTEKRGLVRRGPNPADARSVLVTVSKDGRRAFDSGASEVAALLSDLTGVLTAAETKRLTTLLGRMIDERPRQDSNLRRTV